MPERDAQLRDWANQSYRKLIALTAEDDTELAIEFKNLDQIIVGGCLLPDEWHDATIQSSR